MMKYDERDRSDVSVFYSLGVLFEQNGLERDSVGLRSIPVAPEIPQPEIDEVDDPAVETFGRGSSESLESTDSN